MLRWINFLICLLVAFPAHANLGLGLNLTKTTPVNSIQPVIDLVNPSAQEILLDESFSEWTMYAKFNFTGIPASNQRIFHFFLNNSTEVLLQFNSNSSVQLVVDTGTVQSYSLIDGSDDYFLTQGSSTIIAAGQENDVVILANGIEVFRTTVSTMPSGNATEINVGQGNGGGNVFADTITEFKYYNKRLSDAQLKALGRHSDYGVTASYSASRAIHYMLGQSNSLGTLGGGSAPTSVTYEHISNMDLITKDGVLDDTYQEPAASNGTGALFSNFQQNGIFSGSGILINNAIETTGGSAAVMHIDRGDTGLVASGGNFSWDVYNTNTANQTKLNAPAYQSTLMQMVGAIHGVPTYRVWWQGERDANDVGVTEQAYEDEFTLLLNLWNNHINIPTVIVGLHDNPSTGYANWDTIQAAQLDLGSLTNVTHVSAVGADTVLDEVHLSIAGQQTVHNSISAALGYSLGDVTIVE